MSPKPNKPGLSQASFARVMGVDRSQVTRWVQRGLPMLTDGQVNAEDGAEWVRHCVDNYKIRGSVGAREISQGQQRRRCEELSQVYTVGDESAAKYVAELLLPLMPENTVRAVVAAFLRKAREGSAGCMAEEYNPPAGLNSWLEVPAWRTVVPDEDEWDELRAELLAGRLEKVDVAA